MKRAATVCFMLCWQQAWACAPVRVGVTDQHAPPYYMGSGATLAERPGASIELLRSILKSVGCPALFIRMPVARIRPALAEGSIDMAGINGHQSDLANAALPVDKQGLLDTRRSIEAYTMVMVRSADALAPDIDTAEYFKGRRLGMSHGISYVAALRASGILVDDGAINMERNINKLLLGRVDGYAMTMTSPTDFDAELRIRYHDKLMRLNRPIRVSNTWLAVSKAYYERYPERVDTMWEWIGVNARTHMREALKRYTTPR
jgi:ABC-type amino acid transport substrate-binding protein